MPPTAATQRTGLLLLLCTRHLQLPLNLPPLPLPLPLPLLLPTPACLQARKYAFKCHRKSEGGKDLVYPVNAIAFNRRFGTFATGGRPGVRLGGAAACVLVAGVGATALPRRLHRFAGRRCCHL